MYLEVFGNSYLWMFYSAPLEMFRSRGLEHHNLARLHIYVSLVGSSFYKFRRTCLLIWYLTVRCRYGSDNAIPYLRKHLYTALPWS